MLNPNPNPNPLKIGIIGAGAAGFFAALAAKELNPLAEVVLIEGSAKLLSKVKISGGGRCNVTHSCFDPKALVQNYPRGNRELLGPFHHFQPQDTIHWFESRGVRLKTEKDGRMFPVTDSSSTIIDCLLNEANRIGVRIQTLCKLKAISKINDHFALDLGSNNPMLVDRVILATGSSKTGFDFALALGHTIQPPVPSLFTFNVPNFPLIEISGVSLPKALLSIGGTKLVQTGPLLITHWGFSGPAALKLSAWAARYLAEQNYSVDLIIDWIPDLSSDQILQSIQSERENFPKNPISSFKNLALPKSLWLALLNRAEIDPQCPYNSLSKVSQVRLVNVLKRDCYKVEGKTTNKEEFVTCGGITLSEVSFKTMESRICPGLFFCGEILDIDGVTGGFNFQNAWTTGWIAGRSAAYD
jgi:predicted Rossmann fold flavoprotein